MIREINYNYPTLIIRNKYKKQSNGYRIKMDITVIY